MRLSIAAAAALAFVLAAPLAGLAASDTTEENVERPGADYSTLTLEEGSPARFCHDACQSDERCHAWTYIRAGAGGPNPRCALKAEQPDPRPNPCCVSGVVR